MRGDVDDLRVDSADFLANGGEKLAANASGRDDFAEKSAGDSELVGDVICPAALGGGKHLRGRGDGVFGLLYTGEEIFQKVGDKEHVACVRQRFGTLFHQGIELINRVEIQKLRSGNAVKLLLGDNAEKLLHDSLCCALVAVAVRVFQKLSVFVQKSVVDAPRVDTHRRDVAVVGKSAVVKRAFDLAEGAQNVPIKTSV